MPIDISTIEAWLRFDGATRTASAEATVRFEVGPSAGNTRARAPRRHPMWLLAAALTRGGASATGVRRVRRS